MRIIVRNHKQRFRILTITVITNNFIQKKIAEAMGHEYETHLLSYAWFDSKDLAKSFDQVPT